MTVNQQLLQAVCYVDIATSLLVEARPSMRHCETSIFHNPEHLQMGVNQSHPEAVDYLDFAKPGDLHPFVKDDYAARSERICKNRQHYDIYDFLKSLASQTISCLLKFTMAISMWRAILFAFRAVSCLHIFCRRRPVSKISYSSAECCMDSKETQCSLEGKTGCERRQLERLPL